MKSRRQPACRSHRAVQYPSLVFPLHCRNKMCFVILFCNITCFHESPQESFPAGRLSSRIDGAADHAFLRFISVRVIFCASQRRDFLVCNYSADVTSRSASTGTRYSFSRLSHTGRSSINSMLILISLTGLNSSDKLNLV